LFRRKVKPKENPEAITTQYQKLSGTKLTGQTIDLSQFNKPKKKEEPKITPNKPGSAGAAGAANKNKRKRIAPKPSTLGDLLS
jgi:translation initiation factor IF-2